MKSLLNVFIGVLISGISFSQTIFTNYNDFITELNQLTSSTDNSVQLNTFWDDLIATGNFPFTIDTKVAFLYRGSATTINWAGEFNGFAL